MKTQANGRKLPFSNLIAKGMVRMAIARTKKKKQDNKFQYIFERIYCLNLARRGDRLRRIKQNINSINWPFIDVNYVTALDGKKIGSPDWFKAGGGAWGCFRGHLRLIEDCLNEGVESVLLLEDDAVFSDTFAEDVTAFLEQVPKDWGMLYLGGQHLYTSNHPPKVVEDTDGLVYQPYNINRTHAFALNRSMMKKVYHHLCQITWRSGDHIDHHLGRLHQRREDPIYCPSKWLVAQAEGVSNISGKDREEQMWPAAENMIPLEDASKVPFVAVVGLHSSGSSCMAGVLHHLGVHMGDEFCGYYGADPTKNCGFEAVSLAKLCEESIKFPATTTHLKKGQIWSKLKQWMYTARKNAIRKDTIAGGKYPFFCQMGNQLINLAGDDLRVIHIDRPIEQSVKSLIKRCPDKDKTQIQAHQEWLHSGKQTFFNRMEDEHPGHILHVNYGDLLARPTTEVKKIIKFLDLPVKQGHSEYKAAISYINPKLQHIKES
tara:strand:- start:3696 stop:5162 length:1467 start_codon:yes stop_codon:yes gene_type:complete